MIVQASVTGLVKTILILIGVLVIIRIIGRTLIAKRNLEKEREFIKSEREMLRKKEFIKKNQGKTSIFRKKEITAEDTQYEEL